MIILGIETSCDETAVSIVEAKGGLENPEFKILGSALHSQIDVHNEFGGVVPMLAKREHLKFLPLVLEKALSEAKSLELRAKSKNKIKEELNPPSSKLKALSFIDMIAVTVGPGLEPALWTGITFAKELQAKLDKEIPIIGVNHMFGHVVSVLFDAGKFEFPALSLLISGAHTELIYLQSWQDIKKLGETQDDAAGEAFDKVARMLGLPYPGGPEISRLAEEARKNNLKLETKFPRPMIHSKDYNFSFSGLKTAVLYFLRDLNANGEISETDRKKIAREFEDAVTETLLSKTRTSIKEFAPNTLILAGGVIANSHLRKSFLDLKKEFQEMQILFPEKSLTTDNATMIAAAGYLEHSLGKDNELKAQGRLSFK